MGLIIDTGVFIIYERLGKAPDLVRFGPYEENWISAVTYSELLTGLHLADSPGRRAKRLAYVKNIEATLPILDFTKNTASFHAEIGVALRTAGNRIGAHDLMIAATALEHSHSVLTLNFAEFERVPGLHVIRWSQ